jgi:hypothetical protein
VWSWELLVVETIDTRWLAAMDVTWAAVRLTACVWSAVPWMSRFSAPRAVSCRWASPSSRSQLHAGNGGDATDWSGIDP